MKYDLEIHIEPKEPVIALNFRLPATIVRDFRYVAKETGVNMTQVVAKILSEFISEHRGKGVPKQKSLF